ncbi:MAG TPA: YfiR family protein [Gammaproteobacteria bacterium]|nr:YfiR family protein [Gammaproteobacteria bacterium]MBT3719897.1 YfiR family protein [Gammaproteobacteria bacterium]MBT3843813.1 YfiR family protein [Gammaproteobacteria bacterium]MBT4299854.1 YfiR family protein [Gammaproteobacteria bacterium]MBT4549504.1 YfiR family protein [Gammaproteobacteria bacterium]
MKRLQRKRWMNGWLLVMLLSVAPHTLSYAEDAIPRRVLVGLNLFPNILSVTKGGTAQQTGSDEIELLVVYQKEAKQAKVLADKLRKTTKKINRRKVVVTEISAGSLFSQQHSAGIFLSEKISSAMFRDISNYAITQGALLFSSFEGDVEEGAMVGLDVRSKIRPFLNLTSLERAGLKINPTLLRMCRTVEEN